MSTDAPNPEEMPDEWHARKQLEASRDAIALMHAHLLAHERDPESEELFSYDEQALLANWKQDSGYLLGFFIMYSVSVSQQLAELTGKDFKQYIEEVLFEFAKALSADDLEEFLNDFDNGQNGEGPDV